jgi:hypothetical protein
MGRATRVKRILFPSGSWHSASAAGERGKPRKGRAKVLLFEGASSVFSFSPETFGNAIVVIFGSSRHASDAKYNNQARLAPELSLDQELQRSGSC